MAFSSEFMAYFYLLANKKAHKSFIESNKVLTLSNLLPALWDIFLKKT
jgi:hypothetical protein